MVWCEMQDHDGRQGHVPIALCALLHSRLCLCACVGGSAGGASAARSRSIQEHKSKSKNAVGVKEQVRRSAKGANPKRRLYRYNKAVRAS